MAVKVKIVRKDDQLPSNVIIVTSDGQRIVAQSKILASASPVFERKIKEARKGWNKECRIRISGVSSDAVIAFLQLLCDSSRTEEYSTIEIENSMEKHGMQILALSHVYCIGWLKRKCEIAISAFLTPERVIDTLKLAKLLDAPRLYQQCMRRVQKDFASIQKSEGWRFVRKHDPTLELEILEFLDDIDERKRRWKKARKAQEAYRQLGEAMNCLEYTFGKGRSTRQIRIPSLDQSQTCDGVELLLRHFAKCGKKYTSTPGSRGCLRCKRTSQLLRLHADVCGDNSYGPCKDVPVGLKMKMERAEKFDKTWRLLVKNVARTRVMSSLARRTLLELEVV